MDTPHSKTRHKRRVDESIARKVSSDSSAPSPADEEFLTERQLASRRKQSVQKIRKDRVSGTGCRWVRFGRSIRYALSDVIAEETANKYASTAEYGSGAKVEKTQVGAAPSSPISASLVVRRDKP